MCGPNHGNVSGLANPKDFLLDLGETLIATFHCQITARNHDAEGPRAHGGENEFGQVVESFASFNLAFRLWGRRPWRVFASN